MLAAVLALAATAGHSVDGRPLTAQHRGDPGAATRVLVVGAVHGDEPGGRRVAAAVLRATPPRGTQVWVVRDLNPDGARRHTRQNAHGVDLNRNFPHRWRGAARGRYWPGRRAGSEPETRYAMRLIREIRPDVTVWLHQPYGFVVPGAGSERRLVRRYARTAGMRVRTLPRYRGTAVGWGNATLGSGGAFVVELPAGTPSARTVRRHVRAVWAAARTAAIARAAQVAKPPVHWDPIPFPLKRKRQMRRYAKRHYGLNTHLLKEPRVVVEHFTAGDTYASARNTFAANRPDLGELPGTCAHFVIDKRGTIHQLVSLKLMCRHTVGLNHVAFGIEHVGRSDAQVMGNKRQLRASLALTRWLQGRYGIRTRDVIGHAESLTSRFHHELVKAWRRLTHGDFAKKAMDRYRRRLG
jgi:N-acetylmuramoyl-L-alanine amidase-like protein/zinc carboxypeptidase